MFESPCQEGERYHQQKPPGWHVTQVQSRGPYFCLTRVERLFLW